MLLGGLLQTFRHAQKPTLGLNADCDLGGSEVCIDLIG